VVRGRKGHYRELFEQTSAQGFERFRGIKPKKWPPTARP